MTSRATFNTIAIRARRLAIDAIEAATGVRVHQMRIPQPMRVFRLLTRSSAIPHRAPLAKVLLEGHALYIPWDVIDTYVGKVFEPTTVRLFKSILRPGARVLDIGAHIGFYSLLAARAVGPGGCVFSFEPASSTFAVLQRNIELNGYTNITAIQKAIGSEEGTRAFYLSNLSDCQGFAPHPLAPTTAVCEVECTTIDSFLQDQPVDLVKMDIEGAEPAAITGMRATIAGSTSLTLFSEFNPICLKRAGYEPRAYLDLLTNMGFRIEFIDEKSQSLKPVTRRFSFPEDDPKWFVNLLCTKEQSDRGRKQ